MRCIARSVLCVIAGWGAIGESMAENVAGKLRFALQVGAHNAQDEILNDSANAMLIANDSGAIVDQFLDPRDDAAALGTLEIRAGALITASVQYAMTPLLLLEASVGYESADVGDVEVHEVISNTSRRFSAGRLTRVPLQLTGVVRFRPQASFNPYVGVGVGYSFIGFDPSAQLDELSLAMDGSIGRPGFLSSVNSGGFLSVCGGCDPTALSGASVDARDTFEWHVNAGAEFRLNEHWGVFADLRYVFTSGTFRLEFNDGVPIGVPVPDVTVVGWPSANELPGPMFIEAGGLLDVDGDGTLDAGAYYVQDGRLGYDGPSAQIGVRYTF